MKQLVTILVCLTLGGCLSDEPFKSTYEGFDPQETEDGWPVSTPGAEGMDGQSLEKAYRLLYQDDRYLMARSLLVFRHGKLIAEAYPNEPADAHAIQNIQSCTKSVTSLLAGIALSEGLLDSLSQPLSTIYPEHFTAFPEKADITLHHALSMRTGLAFDNDEQTLEMYQKEGSSVEFVLSQPQLYGPGRVLHYNDGAPQLVAAAIQKRAGKSLAAYAEEKLFSPLGIEHFRWEAAKDGINYGAFSLYLRRRDLGKIGQLLLQKGQWQGKNLVDSLWIKEITRPQGTGNFNGVPYGLYFWLFPAYGGFAAEGHGGQYLMIVPEEELVVVYTAWPYTSSQLWDEFTELMDLIIASTL